MSEVLEVVDDIPVAEVIPSHYQDAARLLERAAQANSQDANLLYMLAMAHKRQGKPRDARNALRKINKPDANIWMQLGLLSLQEKQFAQAEEELCKAWQLDPSSFEICYNLLLTRLTLGNIDNSLELVARAMQMAGQGAAPAVSQGRGAEAADGRFLQILQALLLACRGRHLEGQAGAILTNLSPAEERRLLRLVRGLGALETVHLLLKALTDARPASGPIREAYVEAVLVQAKSLMDRGSWTEADNLLRPLSREKSVGRPIQAALLNMLGCCSALTQDFDGAVRYFGAALKLSSTDPRLHQNLAISYEMLHDHSRADEHWNQFFDHLDHRVPAPQDVPLYLDKLAFQGLSRLANRYAEMERWNQALTYAQQAHRLKPDDIDTLERLFHWYNQQKRTSDARRMLDKLRQVHPDDPQLDLYELDLIEVRGLNDIEKLLTEIDTILYRYPGDARVEDRALNMVGNVIPLMGNLCDQLTDQMSKVIDQVRNLPNYQINWSAVREVMRDLLKEFQKLRRITKKCLPLVQTDEHRRIISDLTDHIDRKMEACRSMGA